MIGEIMGHARPHPAAISKPKTNAGTSIMPTCAPARSPSGSASRLVQAAAHCVTEAAENGGPMVFALIGMMQAINRVGIKPTDDGL